MSSSYKNVHRQNKLNDIFFKRNNKKILNISVDTDLFTYNPIKIADHTSALISRLVYDTLFYACNCVEESNDVLKCWTYDKNLLKYTFELKENYWSNGERLTAYDYYYGLKEILKPNDESPISFHLYDIVNAYEYVNGEIYDFDQVGIKVIDSIKLEVTLCSHVEFFPKVLSMVNVIPIRKDYYLKNDDVNMLEMGGNGAFYLKKHIIGEYIILQRNEYYTGETNKEIDFVIYHVIDEYNRQMELFKSNDIDMTCTTLFHYHDIDKYKLSDIFFSSDLATLVVLGFNKDKPLYYDRKSKKTIYNAINKEKINLKLSNGLNVCNSFVPKGIYYSEEIKNSVSNDVLAKDRVGFKNKYTTLKIAYSNYYPNEIIIKLIANQLFEELSIKIELLEVDFKNIVNNKLNVDYDIYLNLMTMNFDESIDAFISIIDEDLINKEEFCELEMLLEDINMIKDHEELIIAYEKMNKVLCSQLPVLPLFSLKNYYLYNGKFKNVRVDKFGCYKLSSK